MKRSDIVVPEGMEMVYDQFHFAPAVRTGRWLRCSGMLGADADRAAAKRGKQAAAKRGRRG